MNITQLSHPNTQAKVYKAHRQALRAPTGNTYVRNKHGEVFLRVSYRWGYGFSYYGTKGEVTNKVSDALLVMGVPG